MQQFSKGFVRTWYGGTEQHCQNQVEAKAFNFIVPIIPWVLGSFYDDSLLTRSERLEVDAL
jgi:hypothetical protein